MRFIYEKLRKVEETEDKMCKIRVGKALGAYERKGSQAGSDTCLLLAGNKNHHTVSLWQGKHKKKREEKNWQKYYFVKLENVPTGVTET